MVVISDATAITTLLKAGQEQLLKTLFGRVTVPHAVWEELMAFHSRLPDYIVLRPVANAHRRPAGTEPLGKGEAEAIQLAMEINANLLILDDRQARIAAARLGVRFIGLLGLLIKAKQTGRLVSIRAMVDTLEKRGGLYLSDAVKQQALRPGQRIMTPSAFVCVRFGSAGNTGLRPILEAWFSAKLI